MTGEILFKGKKHQLGLSFMSHGTTTWMQNSADSGETVLAVRAAAYSEYMFGKAFLNCSISFVAVSKDESGASFFRRKLAPTLTSAARASDCNCSRSSRGLTASSCMKTFDDGNRASTDCSKSKLLPSNLAAISPTTESSCVKYACLWISQLLLLSVALD